MLRRFGLACFAPRFRWECLINQTVSWFPAPATSNRACRFPALGSPARFPTRLMGRLPSAALSILALPKTYSTPLRPLPSSPGRIPPDFGSCRLLGVLSGAPASPTVLGDCLAAGLLRSPDITPVLRYYEPIRHRLAVSHFPGFAGYRTYPAPPISRWDEDGFSSCLACPGHRSGHRAIPNTPPECLIASVSLRRFMLPSPSKRGLGFRCQSVFEATYGFTYVTAQ